MDWLGCGLAAANQFMKPAVEQFGDWAGLAATDWASIQLNDWNDFSGRACQEAFIGGVKVVAIHGAFHHNKPRLTCQFDHRFPGDPFQNAGINGRGVNFAPTHDEDVISCALCDISLVVEHQRFQAARVGPLDLGEDIIEIVQRFDSGAQSSRVIADCPGGDDFQAFFVQFGGIELN